MLQASAQPTAQAHRHADQGFKTCSWPQVLRRRRSAAFSYAGGGGGSLFKSKLYTLFADLSVTNSTFNAGDGFVVITLIAPKVTCLL